MPVSSFKIICFSAGLLLAAASCHSNPPANPPDGSVAAHSSPTTTISSSPFSAASGSGNPRDTLPFLASDELTGRAPGTPGLVRAGDFIAAEFRRIGLQPPPGMNDYFQSFRMPMSTTLAPATNLLVNDKSLSLGNDFSPISMTGEGPFNGHLAFVGYGITRDKADPKAYDDYAAVDARGKVVMAMRQEPRDEKGRGRFAAPNEQWSDGAFFGAKAKNAAEHGAVALLVVSPPSSGGADQVMPFFGDAASSDGKIPVIQISRRIADMLLTMGGARDLKTLQQAIDLTVSPQSVELHDMDVAGDVSLRRTVADVRNVVCCLPGRGPHADEFVIVGAHYDHLGSGQLGHMLGPVGSIYHGADDNASGTAAVIELAENMAKIGPLPRSILFACFTAEEEGLVGSDYFVKHSPIPLDKVVSMLNLDMVGRLKDNNLLIGGWGTAPIFDSMVKEAAAGLSIRTQSFEKGGLGPSDHMSFALRKIPVLFLFTGLHSDYHRPTDTADKINYSGIDEVTAMSQRIVTAMAAMPRQQYDGSNDSKATMAFASGHGGTRRAALGVVPEYGSPDAKTGVTISGVGDGSPADKAGFKAGDVLTRFNNRPLNNLQDLSDALAEANPGDKATIQITRDGKRLELQVTLGERR